MKGTNRMIDTVVHLTSPRSACPPMSFTLAVLSWGAHQTLENTLNSYQKYGLDKLADQRVIFFQEISSEDMQIADKYNYEYLGSSTNLGIPGGYRALVSYATQENFLFLENDWELIEVPARIIHHGQLWLLSPEIDVVRLRHRRYPGAPLWTLQFKGNELSRPEHLLDSVHWVDNPAQKFPQYIGYGEADDENGKSEWFSASSKHANWTNNPTMFRTDWLRKNIVDRLGDRDVELDIQSWWQQQFFGVTQGEGLFTHRRIG